MGSRAMQITICEPPGIDFMSAHCVACPYCVNLSTVCGFTRRNQSATPVRAVVHGRSLLHGDEDGSGLPNFVTVLPAPQLHAPRIQVRR